MSVLLVGVSGCPTPPIPPVDRVAEVRLTVNRMPDDKDAEPKPRSVYLKEKADIAEIMDWLGAVDWSQSGTDLSVATVPKPDGAFMLINKSSAVHHYSFYWDGGFVYKDRLIRGGDMDKLMALVKRLCK